MADGAPARRIGERLGGAVGTAARHGRRRLGALPGLSATADVIAARHCVDVLAAALREDPTEPRRHVWLAEALLETQRDVRTWARLRTVADPSSILVRAAVHRMTLLGEDNGEEPVVRLLRQAFALAAARAHRGDADPVALHVLARVYLARGMPAEALRLAQLAAAVASDERPVVLVTAARAFGRLGRREDAAHVARRAVEHGSTVGYEVLAQLLVTDRANVTREPAVRVTGWLELRRRVRPEDRARYSGASRTPAEVAMAVKSAQWQKAGSTFSNAIELAGRARGAVIKEPRP